jgi:hypothetical protein
VRAIRSRALLVGATLLGLAGCGSGSGGNTTATPPSGPAAATPSVTATVPAATTTTPAPAPTQTSTSPEQQPGGAGDETPISTQVLFTGEGGDITPATVHVPPFIAVNVILHSKDGGSYGIEIAHHALDVDGTKRTASVQLEGLRRGHRYQVQVTGAPETLAIAEPGP